MTLNFGVYGLGNEEIVENVNSLGDHPVVGNVYFEHSIADRLGVEGYSIDDMTDRDIDFIMSVGGDGTLLRLMQKIDIPALGVNTGTLGFLTSVEISEVGKALEKIDRGDHFIDKRMKQDVLLNGEKKGECTNEAVIHSDKIAKLREIEIDYGDKRIDRFRGDGLIISTPTGSTSYAMSVGGPIINPTLDVFVSVPIASFDLEAKPHVLPTEEPVKINLMEKEKSCLMVLDGQKEFIVGNEDKIEIVKSESKAKFIRTEEDFYRRIRKKLVKR